MASRCSLGGLCRAIVGSAVLVGVVIGCGPGATPGGVVVVATTTDGGATPASPASLVPPVAAGAPSPTVPGRDAPPNALLAAEGGDPVAGQLGTFVWFETGSDAPWLPGAPIAVGVGEPLMVSLAPDDGIRAWTARFVPAAATGPEGATALGEGSGTPQFAAPGPGAWTADVFVEFAGGAGNAHYFWRLEVE